MSEKTQTDKAPPTAEDIGQFITEQADSILAAISNMEALDSRRTKFATIADYVSASHFELEFTQVEKV